MNIHIQVNLKIKFHKNGYNKKLNSIFFLTGRCKYIDMFPNANELRMDPGFDWTLMG